MHIRASNATTLPINLPRTWDEFARCLSLGIASYQEQADQLTNSSSISDANRLFPLWKHLERQIDEVNFDVPYRGLKSGT